MMRPRRYVVPRSRPAARRLLDALEPLVFDADPFDQPEPPWQATTTDHFVDANNMIRHANQETTR
jgi:hypothetical protein